MDSVKVAANPQAAQAEREFLTVGEAADFARVSEVTIRRFLTIGKLHRFKFGARTLIRLAELRALITPGGPSQSV